MPVPDTFFGSGGEAVYVAGVARGGIDEATRLNGTNIAHCQETGDCYMEPECLRLQGELTLEAELADVEAAERLFRKAIDIAQTHGAKSWELRAATSLARLWQSLVREADAIAVLTPVYEWFTEGFETADLRRARTLLAELS